MYSKRKHFIDYVKHGGAPVCSPQIGGGAGFDTKMMGKEWISDTTLDDTLTTVNMFDIVPLINTGCNYESCCVLQFKRIKTTEYIDKICMEDILETPAGILLRKITNNKVEGSFQTKYAVENINDFAAMEYYINALADSDFTPVIEYVKDISDEIGDKGAMDVQWAIQPYELFCFPNTVDTMLLHNDYPKRCKDIMNKIVTIDKKLFKAVAKGGSDFVFLGAPAAEMVSPDIYERLIVPYSQIVTKAAHDEGLMIYSHICSPIEPFLTMGYYNQMGIDLFETLSPPPVGNIKSFEDALSKIDPSICTRGNIGLDVLLNGTPAQIRELTFEILEASKGRKHMVAASDYLFYDICEENVRAMADTVGEFCGR